MTCKSELNLLLGEDGPVRIEGEIRVGLYDPIPSPRMQDHPVPSIEGFEASEPVESNLDPITAKIVKNRDSRAFLKLKEDQDHYVDKYILPTLKTQKWKDYAAQAASDLADATRWAIPRIDNLRAQIGAKNERWEKMRRTRKARRERQKKKAAARREEKMRLEGMARAALREMAVYLE